MGHRPEAARRGAGTRVNGQLGVTQEGARPVIQNQQRELIWGTCPEGAWPTQGALAAGLEKAVITDSAWAKCKRSSSLPGNPVAKGRTSGVACPVPFSSGERCLVSWAETGTHLPCPWWGTFCVPATGPREPRHLVRRHSGRVWENVSGLDSHQNLQTKYIDCLPILRTSRPSCSELK